jgi:hypothetical protein
MNEERQEKIVNTVEEITNLVNSFDNKQVAEVFIGEMSRKHRTLQQSFTQLCLRWIEHCASDTYQTDPRNEDSKVVAKTLIDSYASLKGKDFKPSDYLRCI